MWYQAYTQLIDFISKHEEIKICENTVRIPQEHRAQFYELFDNVRKTFMTERLSGMLGEAKLLSENYVKLEDEVVNLLKTKKVSMSVFLREFIQNPEKTLMKELFDPLFDLLKKRLDVEAFEEEASKRIEVSFKKFYSSEYTFWVELSLLILLKPDKIFSVPIPEPKITKRVYRFVEQVSSPEETNQIQLEHDLYPTFIVPDFIFHSAKIGRYVAIRSEYTSAAWIASNPSQRREWIPLTKNLKPDLLVYVDENLDDIALIADAEKVCRPDLIVECIAKKEWREEVLERAKLDQDALKPKLGTFVVLREPVGRKVGKGIRSLTVRLHQSKLEPIINSLATHLGLSVEKRQSNDFPSNFR